MICVKCRDDAHAECPGTTFCDCQHVARAGGDLSVVLGVLGPPACSCLEHVDQARGRVAVPPPAGCPEHGYQARWVGAVAKPEE